MVVLIWASCWRDVWREGLETWAPGPQRSIFLDNGCQELWIFSEFQVFSMVDSLFFFSILPFTKETYKFETRVGILPAFICFWTGVQIELDLMLLGGSHRSFMCSWQGSLSKYGVFWLFWAIGNQWTCVDVVVVTSSWLDFHWAVFLVKPRSLNISIFIYIRYAGDEFEGLVWLTLVSVTGQQRDSGRIFYGEDRERVLYGIIGMAV